MQKGADAAAAGMAFDTGEVGRLADNFRYVRFGSLADIRAQISGCPLYPSKRTFISADCMSA